MARTLFHFCFEVCLLLLMQPYLRCVKSEAENCQTGFNTLDLEYCEHGCCGNHTDIHCCAVNLPDWAIGLIVAGCIFTVVVIVPVIKCCKCCCRESGRTNTNITMCNCCNHAYVRPETTPVMNRIDTDMPTHGTELQSNSNPDTDMHTHGTKVQLNSNPGGYTGIPGPIYHPGMPNPPPYPPPYPSPPYPPPYPPTYPSPPYPKD